MKKKLIIAMLSALVLAGVPASADKKDTTAVAKQNPYEKLLGKNPRTAQGFLTFHINKGKVYLEIPDSLYGRELVFGATVKSISDNGAGLVGSKKDLMLVCLQKVEKKVLLRECNVEYVSEENDLYERSVGAIIQSFDIKATAPDSSAVIDATDLFLADEEWLSPFVGHSTYDAYKVDKQYKKEYSFIEGAKAFRDNASVTASRTYSFTATNGAGKKVRDNEQLTASMCYSFILLPRESYHPRIADPRIGFFFTQRKTMSGIGTSSKDLWLANRWRVEPSDTAAWLKGEKVLPKKQIVFYIDPCFPSWWKPYIHKAVNDWSKPFERIGFKDAVVAKDFPTPEEDPEFDPDNIKYSCIRYQPIGIQNAMGPSWVDPRSGEILNASVYVYHDVVRLVSQWMFIQTSQVDESVRTLDIPREKLGDALEYVIRHEVGHCLGLMHNMGASSSIPVESLRDPAFTAQNGTTYSIMDYARFNYVAQPTDKDVRLTPPMFGKYDYWAIRWGYEPLRESLSFQEEAARCRQQITDSLKVAPWYRYGKQQLYHAFYDPRNQSEDLSDDVIQASRYGVSNLQYVNAHFMEWLSQGDPDYEYRTQIFQGILNQYVRYAGHILMNVGGLYRNEVVSGDGEKRFLNVPGQKQKACLQEAFSMLDNLDWLENKATLERLPIIGSPALAVRQNLYQSVLSAPFACAQSDGVDTQEFSFWECMDQVYDFTWRKPGKGGLTPEQKLYQRIFVLTILQTGGMSVPQGAQDAFAPISGFEWLPRAIFNRGSLSAADMYAILYKVNGTLKKRMSGASAADKAHYQLLQSYIQYGTSIQ